MTASPPRRPARWVGPLAASLALLAGSSCSLFRTAPPYYTSYVTPSGILVQDRIVPEGPGVEEGQRITLHYEGRLEDGEVFDSSYETGQPVVFVVGAGEVPAGLDEGVLGMAVGGRRELTLPPELAFGEAGVPGRVPPGAVVQFDVELLSIEP